jgi:acetoin utilization deacetylase AcuC-like enzyme
MRVYYTDQFAIPLPEGHRFPLVKYRLLRERILEHRLVSPEALAVPDAASDDQLGLVHAPAYVTGVAAGTLGAAAMRRIGLPWSPELVERSRRSVGGTIAAGGQALHDGVSVTLSGGTHHAARDRGEGYCVFNDVAVAVRVLQRAARVRTAVVIDCDVHQGNGTALIFRDDPSVVTVDLYGAGNYPFEKVPGTVDVPFPDGTGDAEYLERLESTLRRIPLPGNVDLVFYLAGADSYEGDRLGRLALTKEGLAQRDGLVFGYCRSRGLPAAVTMAGGYASAIADTVEIQARTVAEAARIRIG